MKKMLQKIAIFSLVASTMLFSQRALAENKSNDLEIIVDVSGSMNEVIDGKSKMNIAKEVLATTINGMPETSFVGLRAYGHQGTVAEKNCTDTQLLVPISKINKTDLISKINSLTPKGWTPIDYSLRQSKNDFPAEYGKVIILISDGEETCGGDPCAAIKELKTAGFDVTVHTVGFNVGDVAEKQLKCIADATGGEYKSAKNASELADSLRVFSTRAFEDFTTSGGAKAGTGFINAPLVATGDYGGDILMGESKFYKFNAKKGQEIISVASVRRESATTSSIGCTCMQPGIKIFDKYKKEIASKVAEGCYQFSDVKGISGDDLSPLSYDVKAVAENSGEFYVSISGSWDSECTTDNEYWLKQLKTRTPKAFYELTINLEGEGEVDSISAQITSEKNIDNTMGIANVNAAPIASTRKGSSLIWVLLGVGTILIIAIVILIVILLKKKNDNSSNIAMNSPIQDNSYNPNSIPDPNQVNDQNTDDLDEKNNQV